MKIKRIRQIYKGKELSLNLIVARENQKEIEKEVIVFPKTVAILPLIGDKIVLIKQYRFPTKKEIWEIPAGKLRKKEKPEIGAKRELKEETGLGAKKLEKIGEFYLSPGYSTEYMYLFRAKSLKKGKQSLDEDEIIKNIKIFNLKEALQMIKRKEIIDAKTILAILNETGSKIYRA